MNIISVTLFKKGAQKGDLTYFSSLPIEPGQIVQVPFRKEKVLALVTAVKPLEETKSGIKEMDFKLKKVLKNLGESIFSPQFFDSILLACDYFAQNKSNAIYSIIPAIFIERYDKLSKEVAVASVSPAQKNLKPEKTLLQVPFSERLSVYKTLVREAFARGQSVFLVLPTESDILKWKDHLSKGIEKFTFSFYGGASKTQNLSSFEKASNSAHPVLVIATAPFLSVPIRNIGTIILEHENSNAYKMIGRPYFDLRVFTEIYAAKIGARLIMADEILRYETTGRKDTESLTTLYPLSFRIDFKGEIMIPLLPDPNEKRKFSVLREESVKEIKAALSAKKNIFIFSLRKGLATETVCRDCGQSVSCNKCGTSLILYLSHKGNHRMFVCNRCQEEKESDTSCSSCGSWNLVPLGIGTDTVYEEVSRLFPEAPIFKLDKETAKTARGAKEIIRSWSQKKGSILIGTEMTFFYIKNYADLSVIASFDSLWSIPNFKMGEKIIQLILSILANTQEKLVIQTKNPKDPMLTAVLSGNLSHFVKQELEDRRKLGYPPFQRFIKIIFKGDKEKTLAAKQYLEELFFSYKPEIFGGFISRQKGEYVTNALIKIPPVKWTASSYGSIDRELLSRLFLLAADFEIEVDPEDLL